MIIIKNMYTCEFHTLVVGHTQNATVAKECYSISMAFKMNFSTAIIYTSVYIQLVYCSMLNEKC